MKVSVIIPCFNDGHFLKEAVDSVINSSYSDIELIIVNDGSTDTATLKTLESYKQTGVKVLSHPNQGLGFTRNRGIREASGTLILPLDADNLVTPDFIAKAASLLIKDKYDIVYAKPIFIGEDIAARKFKPQNFDGEKLFLYNYIDACAIYRKSVWEKVGGYDEAMPVQGYEDWEFWLTGYLMGFRFRFLNEELFKYRIKTTSMLSKVSPDEIILVHNYIITKHIDAYRNKLFKLVKHENFYLADQRNYLRTSIKYFFKLLKSLLKLQDG